MNKRLYFQSLGLLSLLMINGSHVFSVSRSECQAIINKAQQYCEDPARASRLVESSGPEVIINLRDDHEITNEDLDKFKNFINDSHNINIVFADCGDKRFKQAFDTIKNRPMFQNCIFVDKGDSGNGRYPEVYDKTPVTRGLRFCRVKAAADDFIKFLNKNRILLDRKVNIIWDDWGVIRQEQIKDLKPLLSREGKIFTTTDIILFSPSIYPEKAQEAARENFNSVRKRNNCKIRICSTDVRRKVERIHDSTIWEDINTWIKNLQTEKDENEFKYAIDERAMCQWAKHTHGETTYGNSVIGAPAGTQRMIEITFNNQNS